MSKFTELEVGAIALIQQQENGRIIQIGLTISQSKLLQIFLATLSQDSKLIQMPEDYDLVLKNSLYKNTEICSCGNPSVIHTCKNCGNTIQYQRVK